MALRDGSNGQARVLELEWTFVAITPYFEDASATFLVTGEYDSADGLEKYIVPKGPPLPVFVHCRKDKTVDLGPFLTVARKLVDEIGVAQEEQFVKAFIRDISAVNIWEDVRRFYVLVKSPTLRKLITTSWDAVKPFCAGNNDSLTYTFDTFTAAFVFCLMPDNAKLNQWGLGMWCGVPRAKRDGAAAVSTPHRSGVVPSRRFTSPTSSPGQDRSTRVGTSMDLRLGNQRAPSMLTPSAVGRVAAPTHTLRTSSTTVYPYRTSLSPSMPSPPAVQSGSSSSYPVEPLQRRAKGKQREVVPASGRPAQGRARVAESKLSFLVDVETLESLPEANDPRIFMARRSVTQSHVKDYLYTDDPEVAEVNGPRTALTTLPPALELLLLSDGWSDACVQEVQTLWLGEATYGGFLNSLSRRRMPLALASAIYRLLEALAPRQSL